MKNYEDIGGCYPPWRKAEAGFRGTGSERGKARILEFTKNGSKRHFAIEKWLKGESQETEGRGPGMQSTGREFWIHSRCRVSATRASKNANNASGTKIAI